MKTSQVALGVMLVFVLTGSILFAMDREPICTCGYVKLWHGDTVSSENSQHISDPYSFSHVIHGFAFYGALHLIAPGWSLGARIITAVTVESGWEIFENTEFVINRYRAVTISRGYTGDSIINSLGDVAMALIGFAFAMRSSVRMTIFVTLLIELVMLVAIRDSLLLNIIMLIHPVDAIRIWQSGG